MTKKLRKRYDEFVIGFFLLTLVLAAFDSMFSVVSAGVAILLYVEYTAKVIIDSVLKGKKES
jgi:hypothetical protein